MEVILPRDITADRQSKVLTITWQDGHVSRYAFGLLRAACPCAGCRGGHEKMSAEPDEAVFSMEWPTGAEAHMQGIEGVGSYAIMLEWEDGHRSGIYTWHYLRALCPCDEDRKKAK